MTDLDGTKVPEIFQKYCHYFPNVKLIQPGMD